MPIEQADMIPSPLPFAINTLLWNEAHSKKDDLSRWQCYHYFQIVWIIKGKGWYWIDMQKYAIEHSHVFFYQAGPGTLGLSSRKGLEGFVIRFSRSFLEMGEYVSDVSHPADLTQLFSNAKGIPVQKEVITDLQEITDKMMKEFTNLRLLKTEMLKTLF